MDALGRLDKVVGLLLARAQTLKSENAALAAEISGLRRENEELAAANRALKDGMLRGEAIRMEALRRMEALLRKIQGYGAVDK